MKNSEKEQRLQFELQSTAIAEITNDTSWQGDGVVSLDNSIIQEIVADDDKPFYVEFTALYEGMSNNDRLYSTDAVKSCVDAMVGVNMYKGHEEPGTQSWKYREPVGRIVAAKLENIELPNGNRVLAAKGKAYITEADPKLRSDIRKRMAGSVSILGSAKMVRQMHETTKTVVHLNKPLKSVDFCNPGTGGLSHAGVTAVVSEMAAETVETEIKEQTMAKLTKEELLTEYKAEVTALVGEQIEGQVQEIAAGRREIAEAKVKFDEQISEMTNKVKLAETERDQWKAKYEGERNARIQADLAVFVNEKIAEMKAAEGADGKRIDLAMKRTPVAVIDGDLEASKKAFLTASKAALEEINELAEMIGATGKNVVDTSEKPIKKHTENPGKKAGSSLSRILAANLVESRTKRGAEN